VKVNRVRLDELIQLLNQVSFMIRFLYENPDALQQLQERDEFGVILMDKLL
jgi:hypothetical protein